MECPVESPGRRHGRGALCHRAPGHRSPARRCSPSGAPHDARSPASTPARSRPRSTAGSKRRSASSRDVLARLAAYDEVQPQVWISRFAPQALLRSRRGGRRAGGGGRDSCRWPACPLRRRTISTSPASTPPPPAPPSPIARTARQRWSSGCWRRARSASARPISTSSPPASSARRSPYGAPRNAYNRAYVSGGSSSGSAVAVAAGLVAFALGTDTAGSGRVPAAFKHLIGLKPTQGPLEHAAASCRPAGRSIASRCWPPRPPMPRLVDSVVAGLRSA